MPQIKKLPARNFTLNKWNVYKNSVAALPE